MAFNSLAFAVFLPIVFALYWLLPRRVLLQNLLLLLASYWFYAWWSYKFLLLLFVSSTITYLLAHQLEKTDRAAWRRVLLWTSLAVNLGVLVLFKYLGFFANSLVALLNTFGLHAGSLTLKIILPLGISFYTFQMVGYTIDVYRKQVPAVRNLCTFLLFTGFFPKTVAGPIERASHLVPQLQSERNFQMEQAKDGLRQMEVEDALQSSHRLFCWCVDQSKVQRSCESNERCKSEVAAFHFIPRRCIQKRSTTL